MPQLSQNHPDLSHVMYGGWQNPKYECAAEKYIKTGFQNVKMKLYTFLNLIFLLFSLQVKLRLLI